MTTAIDLAYLTASDAGKLFRAREVSPVELTEALLERVERTQPTLRAFVTVTHDLAMAEAKAAEAAILAGDTRPLLGIPVGYKDIYMTAGVRTTGGSEVHLDWVPDVTAATITKLHDAGVVMLGKLATHEFASGISPEDHPLPPARNPWNHERIPGGSSSGSGAALAAGLVIGATGSDTGGSIRHPATACGIAGLKPTYGLCSRAGVLPLSWSLDHAGPMARSCEDLALMLDAMAGYDAADPASANVPPGAYAANVKAGVAGKTFGVLRSWYAERADPEVAAAVEAALDVLRGLGATVIDVEMPTPELEKVLTIVMQVEAYTYHAPDLRENRGLYPEQLRNRLLSGALFSGAEYLDALRIRDMQRRAIDTLMAGGIDFLVSPTRGKTALTFEEAYADYGGAVSFTGMFNLTGQPALSVPCGFHSDGMPIGLQLVGRPFDDAAVLAAGHAYECATPWRERHPAV